jgi:hypothetical protein
VLGTILIATSGYVGIVIGVLLVNFWLVLDCVDGNIARCTKRFTKYGEFVDALGSYITVGFVFIALGVAAYHMGGVFFERHSILIVILGSLASVCDILARLIHSKYLSFAEDGVQNTPKEVQKNSLEYVRKRIDKELGHSGLFMPFIIVGAIWNWMDIVVLFYFLFNTGGFFLSLLFYIYKAETYGNKTIV